MENNRLLVLVTKGAGNRKQISDQSRAMHLLDCKKIPYELVDGIQMKERYAYSKRTIVIFVMVPPATTALLTIFILNALKAQRII